MKTSEQQSLMRTVTKTTVGIADTAVDITVSATRAKSALIILAVWVILEGISNAIFGGTTSFRIVFTGLIDIVITYVILFLYFFPIRPNKYWKYLLPLIVINSFSIVFHANYTDFGNQATQALGKLVVYPILDILANTIHVLVVYVLVTKQRVVGSLIALADQPRIFHPELEAKEVEIVNEQGIREVIVQAPPTVDSIFYDQENVKTTKGGIPIGDASHVVEELARGDHTGALIDAGIPKLKERFRK